MKNIHSCGMATAEVAAEAVEAARETAKCEAKRKAEHQAGLTKLPKDARYYRTHKAKRKYDAAMRRACEANAVPQWLADEHKAQILAIYEQAERLSEITGIEHEVDHLVPLYGQSKAGEVVIRGLHVPQNLHFRAIPRSLNQKRGAWWFIRDAERDVSSDNGEAFYGFETPDDEILF